MLPANDAILIAAGWLKSERNCAIRRQNEIFRETADLAKKSAGFSPDRKFGLPTSCEALVCEIGTDRQRLDTVVVGNQRAALCRDGRGRVRRICVFEYHADLIMVTPPDVDPILGFALGNGKIEPVGKRWKISS
jgi:hypothetical protein